MKRWLSEILFFITTFIGMVIIVYYTSWIFLIGLLILFTVNNHQQQHIIKSKIYGELSDIVKKSFNIQDESQKDSN